MSLRPPPRPFTRALAAGAVALALGAVVARADEPSPPARDVDLVICLDTSGSMNDLLDACRRKLWDLCSVLAQARPEPRLRIALLSFGGDEAAEAGHVVLRQPLTEDLDTVYEELMALRASGSVELVGRVLDRALADLAWSREPNALRLVFVAGNESADQDREREVRRVCQAALQRDVVVHAIYCGAEADPDAATWREVARFGGGSFAAIDRQATIDVPTPYDQTLSRLGVTLNETYLPFGRGGRAGYENQARQDENTLSLGSVSSGASRASCKASGVYRNGSWDLVDASQEADFRWDELEVEELPPGLRAMSAAQRRAHVEALLQRRRAIQAQIRALDAERRRFVERALAARADADRSLDVAMIRAVRAQAEGRGFRLD